jgi:hypothetical protein
MFCFSFSRFSFFRLQFSVHICELEQVSIGANQQKDGTKDADEGSRSQFDWKNWIWKGSSGIRVFHRGRRRNHVFDRVLRRVCVKEDHQVLFQIEEVSFQSCACGVLAQGSC